MYYKSITKMLQLYNNIKCVKQSMQFLEGNSEKVKKSMPNDMHFRGTKYIFMEYIAEKTEICYNFFNGSDYDPVILETG